METTKPDATSHGSRVAHVGTVLRLTVAALMLGAAGIHFGVMGEHTGISWTHSVFFAAVAWVQVLLAALILLRPSRALMLSGIVFNLAVIGVWLVSRTAGIGIGSDGLPQTFGTIDILASTFEGVAVLALVGLLARGVQERPISATVGYTGVAVTGVAVVALTTFAFSPAAVDTGGAGGGGGTAASNGHVHGVATGGSNKQVKTGVGTVLAGALTGKTPCELSGPPASVGQVSKDAEGHDQRGPLLQQPLTREETFLLADQQAQARAVALRYPTVADAEAAGYGRSTPYVPCIGAHYTNVGLVGKFDPNTPSELLYDGTTPDARIVGLSYLIFRPGSPPEGFAGPNDIWHQHSQNGGLCLKGGVVVGNENTTPKQCARLGGSKVPLDDVWMVHDWIVPGFECSWGVFAGECPELGGRTGGTAWDPPAPNSAGARQAAEKKKDTAERSAASR